MKFYSLSLLTLSVLLLLVACKDEESISPATTDYCGDNQLPTEGCFNPMLESSWSLQDFEDWLVGDWKVIAAGSSNRGTGVLCNNFTEDQGVRFSFSSAGLYTYQLTNGDTGSTAYTIGINTCLVPPCTYSIVYEDRLLDYYPSFRRACPGGISWHDERPNDLGMEVYEKNL